MMRRKLTLLLLLLLLTQVEAKEYFEECDNGVGYSIPGPEVGIFICYLKDCCCCYQEAHVHDLGEKVTKPMKLSVQFQLGTSGECKDRVKIYASPDGEEWTYLGSKTCNGMKNCSTTVYSYGPLRYVKLKASKCYLDWSRIEGTDESGAVPPREYGVFLIFLFLLIPCLLYTSPSPRD